MISVKNYEVEDGLNGKKLDEFGLDDVVAQTQQDK